LWRTRVREPLVRGRCPLTNIQLKNEAMNAIG
jgi:hypothetical protein